MFLKAVPVLPAIHIRTTLEFYEKMLGFAVFNYGNSASVTYGEVEIHFYMWTDKSAFKKNSCYIWVKNIEDLFTNLSVTGVVKPGVMLEDKPRGLKEFSIKDNNGNVICFGENR